MFHSFFPNPKMYVLSSVLWVAIFMLIWFSGFAEWQSAIGFFKGFSPVAVEGERPPFITPERLWTYCYIVFVGIGFCALWTSISDHRWSRWSVWGTMLIILWTYFEVQISVFSNDWFGAFYNLIQEAIGNPNTVPLDEFLGKIWLIITVWGFRIVSLVLLAFFTSHYVFRWRTAMNDYYMRHWSGLRNVEGASQRVQEDTRRFASIMEVLGSKFVQSVMTLIAFLPLLLALSTHITELPFLGKVDNSLVYLAILSALFGTVLLATIGIKLPGLEFNNQKVEAAYRKELVYGEDSIDHCKPVTVNQLFGNVRKNYFRLYFHYMYFDSFRYFYLQTSVLLPIIAMAPSIVAGAITFGLYRQISNAFDEVEESLKFLVNSWRTIIELISIHKRLIAFEGVIPHDETPDAPLSDETVVTFS
ncbi:MAG: peptide antibiotic transporter SbmA [Pseudomonadota bacterium]